MVFRVPLMRLPTSVFAIGKSHHVRLEVTRLCRALPPWNRSQHVRPWFLMAPVQQGQRSIQTASAPSVDGRAVDGVQSSSQRRSRRSTRAHRVTIQRDQQQPPLAADAHKNDQSNTTSSTGIHAVSINQQQAAPVSDVAAEGSVLADPADRTGRSSSSTSSKSVADSSSSSRSSKRGSHGSSRPVSTMHGAYIMVPQPLPRVLILHTGGTLGMDVSKSFDVDPEDPHQLSLKKGTGGSYGGLVPGDMLANLFQQVPELTSFANLDLQVVFNKDSSNVGPKEWVQIAKLLDRNRQQYDAFLVVHGTDTLAYTASALSLMLLGFRKPIVMTAAFKPPHVNLSEVAVCFGGKLMRGNRTQKVDSSSYQAFDSPGYPHLATLGVGVDWDDSYLLRVEGSYRPRFKLEPSVIRIPIVPGSDPRVCYGDLVERGVRGIVLEAFGVGNMPDLTQSGWIPWLRQQTRKGLQVYMSSQCHLGPLHPEIYKAGAMALEMGVEAGPQMTPECAVVKMMLCLAYPDIPVGVPLAGEM